MRSFKTVLDIVDVGINIVVMGISERGSMTALEAMVDRFLIFYRLVVQLSRLEDFEEV